LDSSWLWNLLVLHNRQTAPGEKKSSYYPSGLSRHSSDYTRGMKERNAKLQLIDQVINYCQTKVMIMNLLDIGSIINHLTKLHAKI
jgi:hypothetical protein